MESSWVYPHQDLGEPLHVDGTPVLRPVVLLIVTAELPAMLGVLDSGSPVSVANADLFRWLGVDIDRFEPVYEMPLSVRPLPTWLARVGSSPNEFQVADPELG